MSYRIPYEIEAKDFWKLTLNGMYKSMVGVINVIFIFAMIGLIVAFWNQVSIFIRIMLLFGLSLFTIIQPLSIYIKSKKITEQIPDDAELVLDKTAVYVEMNNQVSEFKWKNIKGIIEKPHLCILRTSTNQGIFLKYENMGNKKEEILNFITAQLKKSK